jgi:transposase
MRLQPSAYNPRVPVNNPLPCEVPELKRQLQARDDLIATQELELSSRQRQIDHLKLQIAKLRRFRFGQSSERRPGLEQMALLLEELQASLNPAVATLASPESAMKDKPVRRKELPAHFERIDNTIEPATCTCPECGGPLGYWVPTPRKSSRSRRSALR